MLNKLQEIQRRALNDDEVSVIVGCSCNGMLFLSISSFKHDIDITMAGFTLDEKDKVRQVDLIYKNGCKGRLLP